MTDTTEQPNEETHSPPITTVLTELLEKGTQSMVTEMLAKSKRQEKREQKKEPPPPQFTSVTEWVTEWLAPVYRRSLDDQAKFRWDPQWWRYPEVVIRLEALWGAYEKMRLEGGPGLVVYFRDYLDPMMSVILSPEGPFHTYHKHEEKDDGPRMNMPEELPLTDPPVPDWLDRN